MSRDRSKSNYGSHIHRIKTIRTITILLAVLIVVGTPLIFLAGFQSRKGKERKELLNSWNLGDYETVFNMSQTALLSRPTDYFLLTVHGFSAYQLGISQINNFDVLYYIDECIWSLRKALLLKESAEDGRVYYVLGKAYSNKGDDYADLAVKNLLAARDLSFNAPDIPEYLGLAYAAVGDYRSSVEAFSQALNRGEEKPSDLLLLSIANSYAALEEYEAAKAYLLRCLDISMDSKTMVTARLFLAEIYDKTGNTEEAENQYLIIIDTTADNAEAHYQLGELYLKQGDPTKARSEWRLAIRSDPAHQKARIRLNLL